MAFRHWFGRFLLGSLGFKSETDGPKAKSYVLIAAPHTTNWDLPVMLSLSYIMDIKISYLAKHTIFWGPFNRFFRHLGGIPVDRRARNNVVEQAGEEFHKNENLVLAISPEGTRKRIEYWKTGFYYIALNAGVPIALGYIDYGRKRGGIGPLIYPTGDIVADMKKIEEFYAPMVGKYPEDMSPIRVNPRKIKPTPVSPDDKRHASSESSLEPAVQVG